MVIWDIEQDFGLWCIPKDDLDEWNWRNLRSTSLRLNFNENSVFDQEHLQKLGWIARIDHYQTLIIRARERDVTHLQLADDLEIASRGHKSWVPLVAYDFLKLLFIIGKEGVDKAFVKSIQVAKTRIKSKTPSDSLQSAEDIEHMAITLALLWRVGSFSNGCGTPRALLEACEDVAYPFVQATRNKKSGIALRKLTR